MKTQAKVKFLITMAIIVLIAMFALVGFQLVRLSQARKKIALQQQQISLLQKQLDSYEKTPDTNYEDIIGEN